MDYWSWWMSGLALSALTLGFWWVLKRPLGVSGSWARVVMHDDDKQINQAEAPFRKNPQLLRDALMQATIEEFGEAMVQEAIARRAGMAGAEEPVIIDGSLPARTPWSAHLTFLLMLIVGGLAAALFKGQLQPQFTIDGLYEQLFGNGTAAWLTLFAGGVLVGFGTQMAGGCTSGHALSGTPRLVPASLLATAVFFATAVLVSILIRGGWGAL